jgi:TolA-binding protein
MRDFDIPLPIVTTFLSVALGAGMVAALWAIRQVRRASVVVTVDSVMSATVKAQAELIEALRSRVEDLVAQLGRANERIAHLEGIIGDWETVRMVQQRTMQRTTEKQAAAREMREIKDEARDDAAIERQHARADRHEAREVAAEARDIEARESGGGLRK